MTKFIILTTQRTGSTYLRLWLNHHINVKSHGEVFLAGYTATDGFSTYLKKKNSLLSNYFQNKYLHKIGNNSGLGKLLLLPIKKYTLDYLDQLYFSQSFPLPFNRFVEEDIYTVKTTDQPQKAIGIKVMWEDLSKNSGITEWINKNNPKFINITRKNKANICISLFMNKKTGIAHTEKAINPDVFEIPPLSFKTCLQNLLYKEQKIEEYLANKDHMAIYYEDFFGPQKETYQKQIQEYLELGTNDLEGDVSIKKVNKNSPSEVITNYDELIMIAENLLSNNK